MKNFFSAIQGKFKSEYHGRYLGHVIEQVAAIRPEILVPLINIEKFRAVKYIQSVSTEFRNKERNKNIQAEGARVSDLCIELCGDESKDSPVGFGKILVEIKVNDLFLENQLEDYIGWLECDKTQSALQEERSVVLLTAYPLLSKERAKIKSKKGVRHMYLSSFLDELRGLKIIPNSELLQIFSDYLVAEGYAMYQLVPNIPRPDEEEDYNALLSFMVLNFLPHQSGHGKVASTKKIARGPWVFSNLIENWQLVSDRVAAALDRPRKPTVRYFPEQEYDKEKSNPPQPSILQKRMRAREIKGGGRYWMTSDIVLSEDLRLEWGQCLEINSGAEAKPIGCELYAVVRRKKFQLADESKKLGRGVKEPLLYNAQEFTGEVIELIKKACEKAKGNHPELRDMPCFKER